MVGAQPDEVASRVGSQSVDTALAAAESEGMPPRIALPRAAPAESGPTQRHTGGVRRAGWLAAGLAVINIVAVGSVFLLRQRRH